MLKKFLVILLIAGLFLQTGVLACTDFVIAAKDKTIVNARSMEFPIDLESEICVVPRGTQYGSWQTKYAFLGVNAYHLPTAFVEGLNEKGLAFSGLMFGEVKYQSPVPGKTLPFDLLAIWALGNFASVDEVKQALSGIVVTDTSIKKLKGMGMHIAIHDSAGKNLVIEFVNGQMMVYDNPVGVMTNRPNFPWQMDNLRNYINLDAHDKKPKMLNNAKIEPTGVGSGLLGLPGDWTPPSRFVRMAIATDAALKPDNTAGLINLAEHLLNIVDIPKGVVKESPAPFVKLYGYAQWVLIKDMTNRVMYYKTYDNTNWKSVSLMNFDLNPGSPVKKILIADGQTQIPDVSAMLK